MPRKATGPLRDPRPNETSQPSISFERFRKTLAERLRARESEIEAAVLARIVAVGRSASTSDTTLDADYLAGLKRTIASVVDYSITYLEHGPEWSGSIPSAAISQARSAARNGVSMETVVLRYIAGNELFGEFFAEEVSSLGPVVPADALRALQRLRGLLLECLTEMALREYRGEEERQARSSDRRRYEIVSKLLADEPVDTEPLGYDFDAWHLGIVATGPHVQSVLRRLSTALSCQLLSVLRGHQTVWAWFSSRRKVHSGELERHLPSDTCQQTLLAVGEPARRLGGWRLTHHEAQAALSVALRKPQPITRCADILLEAAVLRDAILLNSLLVNYLSPLDELSIPGDVARATLRSYLDCRTSVSSTAHALGVTRKTVERRLSAIEQVLGKRLETCLAQLQVALRVEQANSIVSHT